MYNKSNLLSRPFGQPANNKTGGNKETKSTNLFKQKLNTFLMNYFDYSMIILAAVIFVVGLCLFVYPKYKEIVKNSQQTNQSWQAEYEKKLSYLETINNLKKSYQLVGAENESKIKLMVPADSDVAGIISTIEAIALKNSVVLNSIKVNSITTTNELSEDLTETKKQVVGIFDKLPAGIERVKIEVNLSSVDYSILKNVLKTLENNLRLFDVAKINYSTDKGKANLIIYAYYLSNK